MIKYLRNNLKLFYTREKFIFSLVLFSALFTGLMIPFAYGIYCNFMEEDEKKGNSVALVHQEFGSVGDKILINGKEFKIIGIHDWGGSTILIPFAALDKDAVLEDTGLVISFCQPVTKKQYDTIRQVMDQMTDGLAVMPKMPELDQYRRSVYNSVLVLMILIGLSISLNFVIIYEYIWKQRKRQMAVFFICGMSRKKLLFLFMMEYMALILPPVLTGMAAFHFGMRPFVLWMLPYLENSYGIRIYFLMLLIFGGTAAFVFVIAFSSVIKRSRIQEMLWE